MKNFNVKRTFALAASAFALSSAFVGCSDYSEFSAEDLRMDKFNKDYDEAFIERFGTPNPNQNWGFTELEPIRSLGGGMSTRAGETGTVLVNRNEWGLRDGNDSDGAYHTRPYRVSALAHDIQIPGWPHLNGLYYGSTGAGALQGALTETELDQKKDSWQPVGDVTEYEIQYVSAWFRSHKIENPEQYREKLHLSDFFIQNISQDDDQVEYRDVDLTKISISDISTRENGTNIGNISDPGHYTNEYIWRKENSSERINYSLDNLGFKAMDGTWTHVNNFNNQNANHNPELSLNNPQREIKYIKSSGTEDFHCHPVWNTDSETDLITSWVLVHLTWTETVKNTNSPLLGEAIQREGYYLAFDFHAGKQDTKVSQDGYYSNWIVKITPGHFSPETNTAKRVMVEDLGGSFDFDFNDVVFDVAYETAKSQAIISVQAAGGTMPVIIGLTPSDNSPYEAHKLLGDGSMKAINVKQGEKSREVAIYRVPMSGTNLANITISVKNTQNGDGSWLSYSGGTNNWLNLDKDTYGDKQSSVNKNASDNIKAPRAFAVPLRASIEVTYANGQVRDPRNLETKWMQENQCIHDTYYEFDDWAKSDNKTDTGFGTDGRRGWWEQADKTEKLYTKNINTEGDNPSGQGTEAPAVWIPLYPQQDKKCFADYYLTIGGYEGDDAIYKQIIKESTKQITYTVVMESETKQNIEAVLVPADVTVNDNGTTTMSYQGTPFVTYTNNADNAKATVLSALSGWHTAVESENRYETGGKYTYVCRFTFTKAQIVSTSGPHGLSSYFFLYIKSPNGGVTIPEHPSVANKWQWYIHY